MLGTLLETAHAAEGLPTIIMGIIVLALFLLALLWVVGMGSGRPHSK